MLRMVKSFAQFGIYLELRMNEFRKLLLKHYHKLPLSHIEHDTKSHFNHPLPKHPKTDFFNNLMSYTSQALREGISNFCENFENFSENSKLRSNWLKIWARDQNRSSYI